MQPSCNCCDKLKCLLNDKCRTENVYIYIYLGLAEEEFKMSWYYDCQQSFRNQRHLKSTALSVHLWNIKRTSSERIDLKWEIVQQAAPYSNISKCLIQAYQSAVCLHEKLVISLYQEPDNLVNRRREMISKCHHQNKFLLMNFNSNN